MAETLRPTKCINKIGPFTEENKTVWVDNSRYWIKEKSSSGAVSTEPFVPDSSKCFIALNLSKLHKSGDPWVTIAGECLGCGRYVEGTITEID